MYIKFQTLIPIFLSAYLQVLSLQQLCNQNSCSNHCYEGFSDCFTMYSLRIWTVFVVDDMRQNSITPLHVASKWGRSGMVSLLLDNTAIIDCQTRVCICMTS